MTVFHFFADIIQRAKGHSVVAAAAYRAGERILEIRTGEVHDYRRRSGVDHREIRAPRGAPGWCKTRAELWNRAEDAERRKDAQVGRQVELALPRELSFKQRRRLVRRFVRKNFTCRGMVADTAYHDQAGENPHVHILLTMRRLAKENGFSRTKERAWNEKAQLESWRSSWALHVNAALRRAGCHSRVDHRTLEAQRLDALAAGDLGLATMLDRSPGRHFGRAPVAIQARADGIAALTAAQDDAIRTGEVDQPDYEHPAYKAAEYERSWRMQEVLDERERDTERRWDDREGERAIRSASRLFGLFAQPGGRDVYRASVTEVSTAWRPSVVDLPELPESPLVDRALDVAESSGGCLRRLRDLLEDAEGRSHYRDILDAHGEPISLEDVNRAIEEANRRIAAAADRRDRRRTILFARPGGRDLYVAMLGEVESARGTTGEPSAATDDLVLDAVESEAARLIRFETLFQKPWGRGLYVANMRALGDRVTLPEIDAAVAAGEALARRAHCVVEGQALRTPLDVELLETEDTTVAELQSAVQRAEARRREERRAAEEEALREQARIEAERGSAEAQRLAEEGRKRRVRLAAVESRENGRDLYETKLAELDPGWRDRGEPNVGALDAALTYAETELVRIESDRRAAEAQRLAEEGRKRRVRLAAVESQENGRDLYETKLAELDPGWRDRGEPNVGALDAALTYAETELVRIESDRRAAEAQRLAEEGRKRRVRLAAVESQENGRDLYETKLAELDPGWRDRGEPNVGALDAALTHAENEQKDTARRSRRIDGLFELPAGDAALVLALDRQKPNWREGGTASDVDNALEAAEHRAERVPSHLEHQLVLEAERSFPRASSSAWRQTADAFGGDTDTDDRGRADSRLLSDRARVHEIVVGGSDVPALPSLVGQLVTWLRKQVEKLLHALHLVSRASDAVMKGLPTTRPWPDVRPDYQVRAVSDRVLVPASDAEPLVMEVYAEVRDRLDREAAAGDGSCHHSKRDQSEQAHLQPFVDSALRELEGSWSASSGSPRPTLASARAFVFERHRKSIENVILVACYQETGGPAVAEGLERHGNDVRRASDAVMKGLPTTRPWPDVRPDYQVRAVSDRVLVPASDAEPLVMEVYAEVRDRLDREAAAGDGSCHHSKRDQSEQAHLQPFVDSALRELEGSWSASSGSPRPTLASARAFVFERHRKSIENVILVACYQETGGPAVAEGLERHGNDVRRASDAVMKGLPTTRPWPDVRPDYQVRAVSDRVLVPASDAEPLVMEVYAEVRDRLDREAVAGDGSCHHSKRDQSEQAHLQPLVDSALRELEGSWSASSGSPRPTLASARAFVFERHRKSIENVILVACYQETGGPAVAEGLERHGNDVRRASDAVMKGLPTTRPWPDVRPDYQVRAVSDRVLVPASDAEPLVMEVYAEVRDRLDREAAAGDGSCHHSKRDQSEQAHLQPLVDSALRELEGSWSASSGSPRPTLASARAFVFERHRKSIENVILVACYQETGGPAVAEGLEQYENDVRRASDAVMKGLPTTRPWPDVRPDHRVPAVLVEALDPGADADPYVRDVYAAVRDRLEREGAADAGGYSHHDLARSEERYLDIRLEQTLEQQRRTVASEAESSSQNRRVVRQRLQREHRARLRNTLMAACKEQDCDGALYDDRSGRASVPPRVAGDASPTEPLGATPDDQSSLDAASLQIRDEPRPDPAEESARSTQAHRASPSNVPAPKVTLVFEHDNGKFRIKEEIEHGTSRQLKTVQTVLEGLNWLASQGRIRSEWIPELKREMEIDLSRQRSR